MKQIVIDLPKQTGAASYEVELPLQSLKGQANFVLVIKTGHATLSIPSGQLAGITANTEYISIRVKASPAASPDAAAGSRPVVELKLSAGGREMAWSNPDMPITVSIPYKPAVEELGYSDSLLVRYLREDGHRTAVVNSRYDAANGSLVFQTSEFGTFAAAYAPLTFTDLGNLSWAKQAVAAMAARDLVQGTSSGNFSPAVPMSRADFTASLLKVLELKATAESGAGFSDVGNQAEHFKELAAAKQLGIVTGYADNSFKPDSTISRQEMMVIAARALKSAGIAAHGSGTLDAYADAERISAYAKDSLEALLKYGVVNGKNGRLAPEDTLTRAEAAVILYRIWKL
jgi:endo-1,4-beta-xylanase